MTKSKAKQQTEKIKLWGIVQGVGFRPFVAKLADRMQMKGEVLNIGGLVEITLTDYPHRIDEFISALEAEKPDPAEIVHVRRTTISHRKFRNFEIVKSDEGDDEAAMIPSDLAICPHCLGELYDKDNPRYQHPFISCMICGPRYTIIDRIPYDRDNTSMIDFPMCDFCQDQYTDLRNRRHHAQTISCHDCGPSLIWRDLTDNPLAGSSVDYVSHTREDNTAILDQAAAILRKSGVIAFKSVGGYNLVANPFDEKAVQKLRSIKNRESKPFAVMFRNIDEICSFCNVNEVEKRLLESSARPIILLEHKLSEISRKETEHGVRSFEDLLKSRFIGSFLPSFAAQYMLLDRISPLIFTSANLSDMPMIKSEKEILTLISRTNASSGPNIDGLLYNMRQIRVRTDDSVTRVIDEQPQMIRCSKGYAPIPLYIEAGTDCPSILSTGGQLKNSFVLTKGPFTYISQYFGDMDTVENQSIYRENIDRMSQLFRITPEAVACDMHPLYFTSDFASEAGLPVLPVQHHHAHIGSVMAEHNLEGPVVGVSFDGTGFGTDGCIWGGEFIICRGGKALRMSHLKYVEMVGGDSSMKDAVKSALSYISAYDKGYIRDEGGYQSEDGSYEVAVDISDIIDYGKNRLLKKTDALLITKAIERNINTVKSSSMGRLFDGVSSLLGICDYNAYEGQCAIMLEDAAAFAQKNPNQNEAWDLALSFHERIANMIVSQCRVARNKYGTNQVALTGGTFQNKILMEGVLKKLRDADFEPYYNISVSPNDGGIALGQAFIAMHRLTEAK